MSPPLTYTPAYLGLFASLLLAVCCNAYLDIGYGGFAIETLLWGLLFGLTLWCGWSQHGEASEQSRNWQKVGDVAGSFSIRVFIFVYVGAAASRHLFAGLFASLQQLRHHHPPPVIPRPAGGAGDGDLRFLPLPGRLDYVVLSGAVCDRRGVHAGGRADQPPGGRSSQS